MIWRSIPVLALCLLMAITSQTMAVARGSATVGWMVICTGTGPLQVAIDAEGNPVDTPHICPDCMLGLMAASADVAQAGPRSLCVHPVHVHETAVPEMSRAWRPTHARAPPSMT